MAKQLSAQQQNIRRGSQGEAVPESGELTLYEIHQGPQMALMESDATELLYGGARGGGKSQGLRALAVTYCLTYPGAKVVLFRQTFRQLEDTHILELQKELPVSLASYKHDAHNFIFFNGSVLMMRFCEAAGDELQYETAEWDLMLFDEITAFTKKQYVRLTTRCRSTKPWWPGRRIRCAGTPGNIGHDWVYERFVKDKEPFKKWRVPQEKGGGTRQFIPAKFTDNTTLMERDPHYGTFLKNLSDEEYRAAMGDWTILSGQYFKRWRSDVHAVEPFDIPIDWDRYICVDYGFNAPYACLWAARVPSTNTLWVYREHYGKGLDSKEQARRARQVTVDYSEKIKAIVLDPSMFSKVNVKGKHVRSISEDWKDEFRGSTQIMPGNNERIPGWKLMREMLDWQANPATGAVLVPPRLFVSKDCPNLLRTIPLMIASETNIEDINTKLEDHAVDALRYLLRHVFEGPGRTQGTVRYYMTPDGVKSVRS
jgi:hypothetical protein